MAVKNEKEIFNDIKKRFESRINNTVENGSVISLYSAAIGSTLADVYTEIDNNRTPHIWTKLKGEELDATGLWVNLPRDLDESDESYRYRLLNWMLVNEASNSKAIEVKLLNPQKASNIIYIAKTRGCGTGTCYIIPKEYTQQNIDESITEAKERISEIASDALYVEYVIPRERRIRLEVYIHTETGDIELLKKEISEKIKEYINTIAPGDYLSLGKINALGIETPLVEYFNVVSFYINNEPVNLIKALQELDSKFLYDEIIWITEENNVD